MRLALVRLFLAALAVASVSTGLVACDRGSSSSASVTPEPIDELRLYDSYGELLTAVLTGMRNGDLSTVRASIATEGQVATMCPGYTVSTGGPYDPPSIAVAASHCQEVFGLIPEEVIASSLAEHDHGVTAQPQVDGAFTQYYAAECPGMNVYVLYGIFEARGEGLPQAGFEVNGIYTYDGKWGLMNIPRCRGEGE